MTQKSDRKNLRGIMQDYQRITHTFEPIFDERSEILILGSLPSVKSRETGFYYGHPQNRFWRVLAAIYREDVPNTVGEKRRFLLEHHIAVWDVIKSCDIKGSSDGSIQNVQPMNLSYVLDQCLIRQIYANGKTAARLYRRYTEPLVKRDIIELPSTSPANAAYRLERLVSLWKEKLS